MLEYLTVNKDSESITVPSVNATILNAQNAEQLTANVGLTDQVPYQFRPSADHAGIGNRETDEITGGSLVWNQLVQNGNFENTDNWTAQAYTLNADNNILTVTIPESHGAHFQLYQNGRFAVANHKYLVHTDVNPSFNVSGFQFRINVNSSAASSSLTSSVWNDFTKIIVAAEGNTTPFMFRIGVSELQTGTVDFKNAMLIDLTAMFGSAIADYVYSLETATAGAGVAWFRKLFPKPYYAYNAGELLSVSGVSAHRMVGFNAYNPETGTAVLLGGNQYQITGAYTALSYTDIGGNAETITPDFNGLFTPSANGTLTVTGGNSTDTCVHLVWSGTHNGEYEPYEVHEYALDDSLTLRGIPKLDANNELYYDGDTYASDGTVTRRYGIVDLGTLSWWKHNNGNFFGASLSNIKMAPSATTPANIVCSQYITTYGNNVYSGVLDKSIAVSNGANQVWVCDKSYSAVEDFKAAMSGVYLVYELVTPTTETATPYTNPQIVNDWGTEEYVTDSIVPVGHNTFYPKDIVRATEGIPYAPTADGAYTLKVTVSGGTPTYAWVAE